MEKLLKSGKAAGNKKGFTLIELIIVIGILAVLVTTAIVIFNPAQLLAQSRDSQRLNDLDLIKKAISLQTVEQSGNLDEDGPNFTTSCDGEATPRVFVSVPDGNGETSPVISGWTVARATAANLRKIDGNGWMPVNLSGGTGTFSVLPVDPVNTFATGFYYAYACGTFELGGRLESAKYAGLASSDGGNDDDVYEVGTSLADLPDLPPGAGYSQASYYSQSSYAYSQSAYYSQSTYYSQATYTADTTTIANGTNPANTTLAPSAAITDLDSFTLATSAGVDSVTALTVTLTSGTHAGLSEVRITNDTGTATFFSAVANPASNVVSFSGAPPIPVSIVATQYKVRITPKTHALMPVPPGASYAVTGTVTSLTTSNSQAGSDSGSATVTVDNLSPSNATGFAGTPGDTTVSLSWTNPTDSDFSNSVVLRSTAAISDVPTEGSAPTVSSTIGASTVIYIAAGTSFADTGLTNGTPYYYKIFSKDTNGNYSTGASAGPYTPAIIPPGRYWVGGTGNWSDTAHWSTTSGGAGGASVPTAVDDAFFNTSSFTGAGQTMTVNAAATVKNMDWTGVANTPTFAGSSTLNIAGNLTLESAITRTYTGTITFSSTATGKNITTDGVTLASPIIFDGVGGGWTLQDSFSNPFSPLTLTRGTLDTNGNLVSALSFSSSNTNTRSLVLGASNISLNGAGTVWNTATTGGMTLVAGTSTISLTQIDQTFSGGGLSYNDLVLPGQGNMTILGANSFNNLVRPPTAFSTNKITFAANQNITGTFVVNGASPALHRVLVQSDILGTPRTITAAAVNLNFVDFSDIFAAGVAWGGPSVGNALGNTGIAFTPAVNRFWVGNGGLWSDPAHWSGASGGAGGAPVPLIQDTAIFDAASITVAGQTIIMDVPRLSNTNFAAVINNPTLSFSVLENTKYSDLTLTANTTPAGTQVLTFSPRGAPVNLVSAGKTFTNANVTIDAPGGTLTVQDNTVFSGTINLTRGTFQANNVNITAPAFVSSNTNTRAVVMGGAPGGNWTMNGTGTVWDVSTAAGLTVTPNTSSIFIIDATAAAKTFAGGGKTYYGLFFQGAGTGALTISGSNTFTGLGINTVPKTVNFTAGTTQTVTGTFTAVGVLAPPAVITLRSTATPTKWFINAAASNVAEVDVMDSTATGSPFACSSITEGCTDSGNNTGWTFTP